ncbi:hypothetical protein DFS34DRAFT_27920 [Phlyctochytrium arcticum]|nr:hypothetical protein DFS34DRAFT_27920 [Phlyctochytrium arcticum]
MRIPTCSLWHPSHKCIVEEQYRRLTSSKALSGLAERRVLTTVVPYVLAQFPPLPNGPETQGSLGPGSFRIHTARSLLLALNYGLHLNAVTRATRSGSSIHAQNRKTWGSAHFQQLQLLVLGTFVFVCRRLDSCKLVRVVDCDMGLPEDVIFFKAKRSLYGALPETAISVIAQSVLLCFANNDFLNSPIGQEEDIESIHIVIYAECMQKILMEAGTSNTGFSKLINEYVANMLRETHSLSKQIHRLTHNQACMMVAIHWPLVNMIPHLATATEIPSNADIFEPLNFSRLLLFPVYQIGSWLDGIEIWIYSLLARIRRITQNSQPGISATSMSHATAGTFLFLSDFCHLLQSVFSRPSRTKLKDTSASEGRAVFTPLLLDHRIACQIAHYCIKTPFIKEVRHLVIPFIEQLVGCEENWLFCEEFVVALYLGHWSDKSLLVNRTAEHQQSLQLHILQWILLVAGLRRNEADTESSEAHGRRILSTSASRLRCRVFSLRLLSFCANRSKQLKLYLLSLFTDSSFRIRLTAAKAICVALLNSHLEPFSRQRHTLDVTCNLQPVQGGHVENAFLQFIKLLEGRLMVHEGERMSEESVSLEIETFGFCAQLFVEHILTCSHTQKEIGSVTVFFKRLALLARETSSPSDWIRMYQCSMVAFSVYEGALNGILKHATCVDASLADEIVHSSLILLSRVSEDHESFFKDRAIAVCLKLLGAFHKVASQVTTDAVFKIITAMISQPNSSISKSSKTEFLTLKKELSKWRTHLQHNPQSYRGPDTGERESITARRKPSSGAHVAGPRNTSLRVDHDTYQAGETKRSISTSVPQSLRYAASQYHQHACAPSAKTNIQMGEFGADETVAHDQGASQTSVDTMPKSLCATDVANFPHEKAHSPAFNNDMSLFPPFSFNVSRTSDSRPAYLPSKDHVSKATMPTHKANKNAPSSQGLRDINDISIGDLEEIELLRGFYGQLKERTMGDLETVRQLSSSMSHGGHGHTPQSVKLAHPSHKSSLYSHASSPHMNIDSGFATDDQMPPVTADKKLPTASDPPTIHMDEDTSVVPKEKYLREAFFQVTGNSSFMRDDAPEQPKERSIEGSSLFHGPDYDNVDRAMLEHLKLLRIGTKRQLFQEGNLEQRRSLKDDGHVSEHHQADAEQKYVQLSPTDAEILDSFLHMNFEDGVDGMMELDELLSEDSRSQSHCTDLNYPFEHALSPEHISSYQTPAVVYPAKVMNSAQRWMGQGRPEEGHQPPLFSNTNDSRKNEKLQTSPHRSASGVPPNVTSDKGLIPASSVSDLYAIYASLPERSNTMNTMGSQRFPFVSHSVSQTQTNLPSGGPLMSAKPISTTLREPTLSSQNLLGLDEDSFTHHSEIANQPKVPPAIPGFSGGINRLLPKKLQTDSELATIRSTGEGGKSEQDFANVKGSGDIHPLYDSLTPVGDAIQSNVGRTQKGEETESNLSIISAQDMDPVSVNRPIHSASSSTTPLDFSERTDPKDCAAVSKQSAFSANTVGINSSVSQTEQILHAATQTSQQKDALQDVETGIERKNNEVVTEAFRKQSAAITSIGENVNMRVTTSSPVGVREDQSRPLFPNRPSMSKLDLSNTSPVTHVSASFGSVSGSSSHGDGKSLNIGSPHKLEINDTVGQAQSHPVLASSRNANISSMLPKNDISRGFKSLPELRFSNSMSYSSLYNISAIHSQMSIPHPAFLRPKLRKALAQVFRQLVFSRDVNALATYDSEVSDDETRGQNKTERKTLLPLHPLLKVVFSLDAVLLLQYCATLDMSSLLETLNRVSSSANRTRSSTSVHKPLSPQFYDGLALVHSHLLPLSAILFETENRLGRQISEGQALILVRDQVTVSRLISQKIEMGSVAKLDNLGRAPDVDGGHIDISLLLGNLMGDGDNSFLKWVEGGLT